MFSSADIEVLLLPTLRFSNRSVGNHVHDATRRG
jgi:hypothetical protein